MPTLQSMLNKIKNVVKPMMKPNKVPVVLVLVVISFLVVWFYMKYSKEGFEIKPSESDKLDALIKTSEPTLVLFYADWCGHCKTLKPVWDETAEKANTDKQKMVKIDVGGKDEETKELLTKYKIDGFPTILVFQNGKPTPYEGAKTVDGFLASIN